MPLLWSYANTQFLFCCNSNMLIQFGRSLLAPFCVLRVFAPRFSSVMGSSYGENWKDATSVYDFTVNDINGEPISLEKYKGHVLLIVNVASKCGLTATNYKELVELDEKYRDAKGLRILAFPCNQFSNQEPGSSEDIVCFAKKKNATFDMFEKIEVNGKNAHPLWKYLKHKQGGTFGDNIKWNFSKFIVDKTGQPVERFAPTTSPSKLTENLEKYF
ncbi:glutathione peroxidase homolog with thioredoxin peroxidase activity isoform X2 [Lycorma delicatula]|uniref:glutathione peroxidase homolog with thioredoxin peroxidase activity isoform X2 n=2 Tax=Lycorma delicatula TaxID=130591 RepID=UPI003F51771B